MKRVLRVSCHKPKPDGVRERAAAAAGSARSFDWSTLVARKINPVQVLIIEALAWIGQPLSATELASVLEGDCYVENLTYHLKRLREIGAIRVSRREPSLGGRTKTFYVLGEGESGAI